MTHKGTITLETASLDDCHVLAEMNKQLIDDEGDSNAMTVSELEARMRKWLSEGLYTAYLFKVNGTIAAYALVDTTDKPPWVRHFFVCREYRRQRYGRMAVNALIDELKANEIGLSCLSENARGLAFWRSFNHKQHSVKFRISKGTPKLTFAPYGLNADREFLLAAHTETFLLTFKKEITPEQFESELSKPRDVRDGAYLDGKLVGICDLQRRSVEGYGDYGHVNFFYVAPELRDQGFGGQLIKHAVDWCREQGLKMLFLNTGRDNLQAQKCYEKNGFERHPQTDKEAEFGYVKKITLDDLMVDHYTPSDDSAGSENNRFDSRVGQVEFRTTIHHIEKYLTPGARILEIGAASGRYSHYFAQRGYEVDAVELVPYNIELFKEKTQEGECVTIRQGNATDLSEFSDETYDVTLLLGPMYHLFERSDKLAAMSEALRVTKPGGVLLTAYCLPDASIVQYGFVRNPDNAQRIIEMGLLDPVSFRAVSRPPEVFDLMYKEDIDALMSGFPSAERISFVATDLLTHYIAPALANMTDEQFELYLRYHLAVCERSDMLGVTNHALDIVRKL